MQVVDLESDSREQEPGKMEQNREKKEVNRRTYIELVTIMFKPLGHSEEAMITQEMEGVENHPLAFVPSIFTLPKRLWGR